MKTLLFVQTGDARPKCAGTCQPNNMEESPYWHNLTGGLPGIYGRNRAMKAQRSADHWWLVECENADAGRLIIREAVRDPWCECNHNKSAHRHGICVLCGCIRFLPGVYTLRDGPHLTTGRILASGGRHA